MSLSSLIVQREVASIRQVEEALARQVLYGGDLVTNLLEVVQLPEGILVPLLAESLGLPHAPIGMLPAPSPEARALVPEDVAARRVVMPLSLEQDRLVLAVSEPLGPDVIEELSFALGKQIVERIAPTVRIREALARVYGVPLERRMARLVGRLAGVDPTIPNSLPPLLSAKLHVSPLPRALSDLPPALVPPGTPALATLRMPEEDTTLVSRRSEPVPPGEPEPQPGSLRPPRVPDTRSLIPRLQREGKAPSEPVRRRRGPLTLAEATHQVAEANDREALLQLFFDFAHQFFEYSALFIVHGDLAEGREAYGERGVA